MTPLWCLPQQGAAGRTTGDAAPCPRQTGPACPRHTQKVAFPLDATNSYHALPHNLPSFLNMSSTAASDATSERPGPSREWSKTTLGKEMGLYSSHKHMISAREADRTAQCLRSGRGAFTLGAPATLRPTPVPAGVQIDITSDKKVAGRPSFSEWCQPAPLTDS